MPRRSAVLSTAVRFSVAGSSLVRSADTPHPDPPPRWGEGIMLSSQSLTPPPLRGRSARSAGWGVLRNARRRLRRGENGFVYRQVPVLRKDAIRKPMQCLPGNTSKLNRTAVALRRARDCLQSRPARLGSRGPATSSERAYRWILASRRCVSRARMTSREGGRGRRSTSGCHPGQGLRVSEGRVSGLAQRVAEGTSMLGAG